ncbi:MAG: SOS response-associated peptidase, partial [Roseibium sp.]|nr:SOS response-associated peptidase [Roseibium sp.]
FCMCGRFKLKVSWSDLWQMYNLIRPEDKARNTAPRYNIAPTQDVPFIHVDKDGNQVVSEGRWWLVPHWAKEPTSKWPMFNARSEDAHKKPAFRDAYKTQRCLMPADGYYEWTKNAEDGKKDPWLIELPEFKPFSFAGLWAYNSALDVTSCTILTAAADPNIKDLHHRMPIILKPEAYENWIDPDRSVDEARELLGQNLGSDLTFHRVSRAVNSSRVEGPQCAEAV